MAKEAHQNDETLRELLDSLGIKSIYPNRMEADDVISWLVGKLPGKKIIVTVDVKINTEQGLSTFELKTETSMLKYIVPGLQV